MKESEAIAHSEIKTLEAIDDNVEFNARHHNDKTHAIAKHLIKLTSGLIDKDGNNISDFFIDNGVDNHQFPNKRRGNHRHINAKDLHENILDTIRAIRGDTNTLLNE